MLFIGTSRQRGMGVSRPVSALVGSRGSAARPEIEAAIVREGLGRMVRWVGHPKGGAKSELLRGCLVSVSLSETFGVAATQAMETGNIQNLETASSPRGGLFVAPCTSEAFAGVRHDLRQHTEVCVKMRVGIAQREVRRYLWDKNARVQEDFSHEGVARRQP